MTGYWDIHNHILPGVDDGSGCMRETMEMLEEEYRQGVRHIVFTPHYRRGMFAIPREEIQTVYARVCEMAADRFPEMELKAQIAKAKNDYLLDKNTDFAHADLAHRIQDYLNEKFKPIISDEARKVSLIRVPILGINGFSNMSLENIINGQYDVIAQNLIYTLCDLLSKSNAVNHVKRNSFPDDESFFTFLKADGNDTIIGSKFSIRSSDYANREQLNDIISSKKSVLEGYTDRSLLIRENMLHIFIDDIRIGTHSGTLSEERNDIIFDSRTQSYLYEVTNNIPIEFNKDELLQYLHDRRKIVNIVLYISVHKEEGKIGNLLVTEN